MYFDDADAEAGAQFMRAMEVLDAMTNFMGSFVNFIFIPFDLLPEGAVRPLTNRNMLEEERHKVCTICQGDNIFPGDIEAIGGSRLDLCMCLSRKHAFRNFRCDHPRIKRLVASSYYPVSSSL